MTETRWGWYLSIRDKDGSITIVEGRQSLLFLVFCLLEFWTMDNWLLGLMNKTSRYKRLIDLWEIHLNHREVILLHHCHKTSHPVSLIKLVHKPELLVWRDKAPWGRSWNTVTCPDYKSCFNSSLKELMTSLLVTLHWTQGKSQTLTRSWTQIPGDLPPKIFEDVEITISRSSIINPYKSRWDHGDWWRTVLNLTS